jgi:SAM-dependent methyltransferase
VDGFFFSHAAELQDKEVLDIGGKKTAKRGLFNIGAYAGSVRYINTDPSTEPDILCDAAAVPLPSECCDVIVLGEVLEHVPEPKKVLQESYRLLRPGGRVFATIPFIYPLHADPHDFGRYTDYYWREAAKELGFAPLEISRHGTFFAVLALMVQHLFRSQNISWQPLQTPLVSFLMWLDRRTTNELLR